MTGSPSVAAQRVDGIRLHLVPDGADRTGDLDLERPVIVDLGVPSDGALNRLSDRLGERLARIHEAYTQTTFYLFDPESWR
jgi:hypothetical protein